MKVMLNWAVERTAYSAHSRTLGRENYHATIHAQGAASARSLC